MTSDWTMTELKPEEQPLFERLLQLYLYDFSEFDRDQIGDDGRFTYFDAELPHVLHDSAYHILLVRVTGKPAGFVVIRRLTEHGGHAARAELHEFFIMRAFRRLGLGRDVALALFDRYPGQWEVGEIAVNVPAVSFWRRVIGEYTGGHFHERPTATPGLIQSFDTRERGRS